MNSYRWYFHAKEEGGWNSLGALFFKPPYKRVTHIPVTPKLLQDAANKGRWDLQYPPHTIPKRRWDLIINGILFLAVLLWALYTWFK
jgi:hypothetical protein